MDATGAFQLSLESKITYSGYDSRGDAATVATTTIDWKTGVAIYTNYIVDTNRFYDADHHATNSKELTYSVDATTGAPSALPISVDEKRYIGFQSGVVLEERDATYSDESEGTVLGVTITDNSSISAGALA